MACTEHWDFHQPPHPPHPHPPHHVLQFTQEWTLSYCTWPSRDSRRFFVNHILIMATPSMMDRSLRHPHHHHRLENVVVRSEKSEETSSLPHRPLLFPPPPPRCRHLLILILLPHWRLRSQSSLPSKNFAMIWTCPHPSLSHRQSYQTFFVSGCVSFVS